MQNITEFDPVTPFSNSNQRWTMRRNCLAKKRNTATAAPATTGTEHLRFGMHVPKPVALKFTINAANSNVVPSSPARNPNRVHGKRARDLAAVSAQNSTRFGITVPKTCCAGPKPVSRSLISLSNYMTRRRTHR